MLDRPPFVHVGGAVHRVEFGVHVIDAEPFKDHAGATNIWEGAVKEEGNLLCRSNQLGENLVGQLKGVAWVVIFGDHNRHPFSVGRNAEEGQVVFIFPNWVGRRLAARDLAKNTIRFIDGHTPILPPLLDLDKSGKIWYDATFQLRYAPGAQEDLNMAEIQKKKGAKRTNDNRKGSPDAGQKPARKPRTFSPKQTSKSATGGEVAKIDSVLGGVFGLITVNSWQDVLKRLAEIDPERSERLAAILPPPERTHREEVSVDTGDQLLPALCPKDKVLEFLRHVPDNYELYSIIVGGAHRDQEQKGLDGGTVVQRKIEAKYYGTHPKGLIREGIRLIINVLETIGDEEFMLCGWNNPYEAGYRLNLQVFANLESAPDNLLSIARHREVDALRSWKQPGSGLPMVSFSTKSIEK